MRYIVCLLMVIGLVACGGGRQESVPKTQVIQPSPSIVGGNPKFADSDPVDWPSARPWQYAVHGVDVARYQQGLDWQKMAANRISFAFIKATEGGDHLDPEFANHWRGAARAGISRGAYHFYYFCRNAREQAAWFIRNVPKTAGALPPVLDIEWNHTSPTCRSRPEGRDARASMRQFLRIVKAHYGKAPIIYTTVDFYRDNELSKVNGYTFWLRSVADHPSKVYPGQRWGFWQYSGTGRVPGAPSDIDLNVFHGSPDVWAAWKARNGVQ